MQDIIKAQIEEEIVEFLDKKFPYIENWKYEIYTKHFSNWHNSYIHQLLQALIEREEKELIECEVKNLSNEYVRGHDDAKKEIINNLKTLQDNL